MSDSARARNVMAGLACPPEGWRTLGLRGWVRNSIGTNTNGRQVEQYQSGLLRDEHSVKRQRTLSILRHRYQGDSFVCPLKHENMFLSMMYFRSSTQRYTFFDESVINANTHRWYDAEFYYLEINDEISENIIKTRKKSWERMKINDEIERKIQRKSVWTKLLKTHYYYGSSYWKHTIFNRSLIFPRKINLSEFIMKRGKSIRKYAENQRCIFFWCK